MKNMRFPRVAFSASVALMVSFSVLATVVPTDFAKKMALTPSTTALAKIGETAWTDFPVLVRLPAAVSSQLHTANGTDLYVEDENEASLAFEVESFDPAGATLVWVKVPSLSSATKLTVYFGGSANADNNPAAVWTRYAGVWHFPASAAGTTTVADATGNSLDGTTTGTISTYAGPFGGDALQSSAKINAPDYDSLLSNVAQFSVSGWFKAPNQSSAYYTFASKKADLNWSADQGWYLEMSQSKTKANLVLTGSNNFDIPDVSANWNYFHLVSDGSTVKVYMNGSTTASKSASYTVKASSKVFLICGANGCSDEYRVRAGAASAAETALEYATMADAAFFDAGAIESVDATAQVFETPTVVRNANGTYTVTVVLSSYNGDVGVIYDGGAASVTNIIATAAAPGTYTDTPANLTAGTTYKFSAYGKNANNTEVVKAGGIFYNGDISVTKISDANEAGLVPGVFRISRADSSYDLPVTYTVGGTAVADQSYVALSGTATIPAGETYVDVAVTPLNDPSVTENASVVLSLASGLYGISASAGAATMTIANLDAPAGFNTWVASAAGLASVDSNWSAGHAPTSTESVLFDGRFSTANCEWDAAASATVASWTQTNGYTGVITLKTVYPGKGDFQCLTIEGDMTIDSGTITHPLSLNSTSTTWLTGADIQEQEVYRLCLDVGGTLTIGASGKIDVKDKGHYQSKPSRDCYGAHAVGYSSLGGAAAYGNPKEPIDVGMGCIGNQWAWVPYPGSGAIRITAGNVVVNGKICADAGSASYGGHRRFTAAAGSIWIDADSITGTGSITAVAVKPPDGSCGNNGRGSGGSIALWTEAPVALGSPFVSAGAAASGLNAPGTVFLHDQNMDKGVLIIDGMRSGNPLDYRACVYVTTDGDWTFDEVRLQNYGALSVPVGTTLALPGGWSSITSTNAVSAANHGVLRYEGGTISAGTAANVVLNGRWMLTPWSNLVMNANVTVKGGAAIGVPQMADILDNDNSETPVLPAYVSCNLTVNGDLTVESDGYLLAKRCGLKKYNNSINSGFRGVLPGHTHGGRCRFFKSLDAQGRYYIAYDSVFAPCLPGNSVPYPNGQSAEASGGVLSFVVTGALTLDGEANANGMLETYAAGGNCSGGTGGAIDITAGTLSGSGRILAEGGSKQAQRGSGGRIAVKLTSANADFSNFSGTISASGRARDGNSADTSAGTVYLQTAAEGDKCGTVYIAMSAGNRLANNTNTTEMVSLGYGGDAVEDYKRVSYVVRDFGHAAVNTNFQAEAVTIADADSSIDLEGHELRTKTFQYSNAGVLAKLSGGTYTAAQLEARGITCVVDTSDDKTGTLTVCGSGFLVILR